MSTQGESQRRTAPAPRTAIVLAAGNGQRLLGKVPLKPLLRVGGITLIERAVLNLQRAGIEHFRIVVGAKADVLVGAVQKLERLRGLDLTFVECPDWQLGNGISFATGATGLHESFLVSMADHVTDGRSARRLLEVAQASPATPKLVTDPHPERVFDLADATKVRTRDGRIEAIGKELSDYDQVDTGLFYFPAGSAARLEAIRQAGAVQLSDFVRALAADEAGAGFEVVPCDGDFWQDVDTAAMAAEAEKRLLATLVKPTDGPVSRYFNRPLSLRLTRVLARFGVAPNTVTTFVFLLTLGAAVLAALAPSHGWLALAGLLFHVASVIDGCDGELSRYVLKGSKFGAWYDTLTDNARYAAFFAALGVHTYRATHRPLYAWATVAFVLVAIYLVSMMVRHLVAENAPGTHLVITAKTSEFVRSGRAGWFERVVWPLRPIVKQDVQAVIVMFGLLLDLPALVFWLGLTGVTVMAIQVRRMLKDTARASNGLAAAPNGSFVMFLLGAAVLAVVITRAPLAEIRNAVAAVGWGVPIAFGTAITWFLLNTLSLAALLGHDVGIPTLLHNRLVGEAINNLVPLAGVAGEPYKIRHLAGFVPLERATRAVVTDKALNVISGLVFLAASGLATIALVEVTPAVRGALLLVSALSGIGGIALSIAALSAAPWALLGKLLRNLRLVDGLTPQAMDRGRLARALGFNVLGRVAALLEVLVLLHLLGLPVNAGIAIALGAVLGATNVMSFLVPQGLGVAEAGVAGAFVLLGLPVHLGLAFALLRRARIIAWGFVGLALLGFEALGRRFRGKMELEPTP